MQISNNSKEIRSAKENNCKQQHPTSKTTAHTYCRTIGKSRRTSEKVFFIAFLRSVYLIWDLVGRLCQNKLKSQQKQCEKKIMSAILEKKKREWYGMSTKGLNINHTNPMKKKTTSQTSNTVLFSETPIKS